MFIKEAADIDLESRTQTERREAWKARGHSGDRTESVDGKTCL